MQKIRKGDTIEVVTGKDIGQRGEVLEVLPKKHKVIVEGINIAKKHQKAKQGAGGQQIPAQIVDFPAAMDWSNVMVVCPTCDKHTRVGARFTEDGTKTRYCKKCDAAIE